MNLPGAYKKFPSNGESFQASDLQKLSVQTYKQTTNKPLFRRKAAKPLEDSRYVEEVFFLTREQLRCKGEPCRSTVSEILRYKHIPTNTL